MEDESGQLPPSNPTNDASQAFTLETPKATFPAIADLNPYYDIAFNHVSLESNLINYRFVWCMFANGVLMTLYVNSNGDLAGRRVIAIAGGLLINALNVILVQLAIKSQKNIYNNLDVTLLAMRSRATADTYVPVHSTSFGGGQPGLGRFADWLILGVSLVFFFVWAALWKYYP